MPQLRITQTVTEFGRNLTAGQLDPAGLTPLQELALVFSGMAEFVGNPDAVRFPDDGVVPITTVMLANPATYGLNFASGRTYECAGARYYWDPVENKMLTAGGITPEQVASMKAGRLLRPDGGVAALSEVSPVQTLTATGTAQTGAGFFRGIAVRAAVGFPQTVTVYDATSATGTPIATFTVNALGTFFWDGNWTTPGNGAGGRRPITTGLHAVISGGTSRTIDTMVETA